MADGLVIWAVPALRKQTQHAIDLWNTAIGRDWLTLTSVRGDAQVHVLSQAYSGDAPHSGVSRANLGGAGVEGTLNVWINPDTTPNYLLPTITHELGHSLGLDDAYAPNRMSQTPSNRGTMSKSVPPGPTEGAQARGDQGLAAPFYWSPEAQADYQDQPGASQHPDVARNMYDPIGEYGRFYVKEKMGDGQTNDKAAINLVTAGLRARGADPRQYSFMQFVQDVRTMGSAMSNRVPVDDSGKTKPKKLPRSAPVGGGDTATRRE